MSVSIPLTFGELKPWDYFISFPIDGDDRGHGGYRGSHNLFIKTEPTEKGNAQQINIVGTAPEEVCYETWSHMTNKMKVVKINV